jgi:site-specific DNA recombinase
VAPSKPRRVLGYARVSSAEQTQGSSLTDQQERIRREGASRGIKDVKLYVEAESGGYEKHERREQIHALMAEARAGDVVIVDKLDRFSRDPEVTYRSIRELREKGAAIYFVAEQLDPSTPNGEMALGMWITFARSEHRRIRDRMVGTREGLQAQGYYTLGGRPPYGYRRPAPDPKDHLANLTLIPEPDEAETVRQIFRRYASGGVSQRQLAEEFGLTIDYVNAMLSRRTYIGQVQLPPSAPGKDDGAWIKGRHEAIVDVGLFERVQAMSAQRTNGGPRPRRGPSGTSDWILRDVARCGLCQGRMRSSYRGPKGARAVYYQCSNRYLGTRKCRAPHFPVEEAEEPAAEMVLERLEALANELAKPPAQSKATAAVPDFETKREALRKRRARALDMYETGAIERGDLSARLGRIDSELAKLEAEEATAAKPPPLAEAKVRREMLKQVRELARAFQALAPTELRSLVNVLVVSVGLVRGRDPRVAWRTIADVHERLDVVREALLKALGRAPTWAEMTAAVVAEID